MTDNSIPKDPVVLTAYLLARGSEHLTAPEREQVNVAMAGYSGQSRVAAVFDSDQDHEFFFRHRCCLVALIGAPGSTASSRRGRGRARHRPAGQTRRREAWAR